MKKFGRLLVFLATIVAVALLTDGMEIAGVAGPLLVGFAFCLFFDLLEFLEFSRFTNVIRIGLFYITVIFAFFCAFAASYQDLFGEYVEYYGMNIIERIIICGAMPGTVASLWLATLIECYDARKFVPLVMLGGLLAGGVVGFVLQLLSMLGSVALLATMIAITVAGLVPLFGFFKKNGWLLNSNGAVLSGGSYYDGDDDYNTKRKPTRSYGGSSSYSSSYGSSSSGYSEGDSQLDYYMQDLAYEYSTSRNLPFDVSISSSASFSHYGDDAYFTVDFTFDTTGCSATSQSEADMALRDAQRFQQQIIDDLFREGKKIINRLKQKYPDFRGVNFEVKVGNINEY